MIFCAAAVGEVVSITVTVLLAVEELLLASVTVSVTELAPISEQVKAVLLALKETEEQLSVLPLSISDAVMLAFPLPSR